MKKRKRYLCFRVELQGKDTKTVCDDGDLQANLCYMIKEKFDNLAHEGIEVSAKDVLCDSE